MAHTFSNLMYHLVFSTSQRRPLLQEVNLPSLTRIIGGIIHQRDGKLLAFNAIPDHIHALAILHPKHAISDMLRDIKAISSDWVHEQGTREFAWQNGYSAFTVSKSVAQSVEEYIARQIEHHTKQSFEEELIALLEKHGIDYDPRFVFD
jgi:REP element-mobilizing transposase RayT